MGAAVNATGTVFVGDNFGDAVFAISESSIPTLTEWGLIILFALAVAGVIWTFVRRRRAMATA
jgi:membrane protein DedA with SNARE-associated domain